MILSTQVVMAFKWQQAERKHRVNGLNGVRVCLCVFFTGFFTCHKCQSDHPFKPGLCTIPNQIENVL